MAAQAPPKQPPSFQVELHVAETTASKSGETDARGRRRSAPARSDISISIKRRYTDRWWCVSADQPLFDARNRAFSADLSLPSNSDIGSRSAQTAVCWISTSPVECPTRPTLQQRQITAYPADGSTAVLRCRPGVHAL